MKQHLGGYGQKQIRITSLHSGKERRITGMALDYSGSGIALLQVGAGMHLPQIERRRRYINELARSVMNGLPYACPRRIFHYLVTFVTSRANMFRSTIFNSLPWYFTALFNSLHTPEYLISKPISCPKFSAALSNSRTQKIFWTHPDKITINSHNKLNYLDEFRTRLRGC